MTITETLVDILDRPILDADRQRAALLLLDWTGCAVAGRQEPAGQKVADSFPGEIGNCIRIGSSKASPQMAAFHNGCLGNVLEMDDVDKRAVLHAGPTVIPAALAMAEHVGASAQAFLEAIIIGYEVTIRIGRAVGPGHYAYWHNTATCGVFGAAAAACSLLEGSDLVSALGLAGTQASGFWQTRHEADSMAKQLHAGHAAQAGVQSALLSAQGFQGPRSILEGEQGFFAATCPGGNPDDVLADYGGEWLIHQTSIKPYPACRHAHAAIDAAKLVEDWDGKAPILVETYSDALKFCDRPHPKTIIDAKFSLQHAVALVLAKRNLSLDDFELDVINHLQIKAIRDLVEVRAGERFNEAYPAHYGAAVIIGEKRYEAKDAYGDPEFPLDDGELFRKAVRLMQHGNMTYETAKSLCGNAAALSIPPAELDDYLRRLP